MIRPINGDNSALTEGLTEAQILASGYSVEDFKHRLNMARELVRRGNQLFAMLPRLTVCPLDKG